MELKAFGERIRVAREKKNMSQEALAHALGKDQRAISDYEMGKRRMSVIDLPILASTLEMPIIYFYGEEVTFYDLDQEMMKLFHALPTSKARQTALEYVRLLSETIKDFTK